MTFQDIDWKILRGALVVLTVSVAVSGALVYATYEFRNLTEADKTSKKQSLVDARSRYRTLDEERRMLETYLPQYRALEEEGIVGTEQRLNWLETLRVATREIKLPALRYEITSQQEYLADFSLNTGVFKVYESTMNLELGLLHEEDLTALLEKLERQGKGFFNVVKCNVARSQPEFRRDPARPNLTASCGLSWLTIRPPEANGVRSRDL